MSFTIAKATACHGLASKVAKYVFTYLLFLLQWQQGCSTEQGSVFSPIIQTNHTALLRAKS